MSTVKSVPGVGTTQSVLDALNAAQGLCRLLQGESQRLGKAQDRQCIIRCKEAGNAHPDWQRLLSCQEVERNLIRTQTQIFGPPDLPSPACSEVKMERQAAPPASESSTGHLRSVHLHRTGQRVRPWPWRSSPWCHGSPNDPLSRLVKAAAWKWIPPPGPGPGHGRRPPSPHTGTLPQPSGPAGLEGKASRCGALCGERLLADHVLNGANKAHPAPVTCSSTDFSRSVTEVLPLVPVTPTMVMRSAG